MEFIKKININRIIVEIVFIVIAISFLGCNQKDIKKETAEQFIRSYYKQYKYQDEIKEIFEVMDVEKLEEEVEKYIGKYFENSLTEKAIDICLRNRIIPLSSILNKEIYDFKVEKLTITQRKQESEQNTYDFEVKVNYKEKNQRIEKIEKGTIVLEKEGEKIDYFSIN